MESEPLFLSTCVLRWRLVDLPEAASAGRVGVQKGYSRATPGGGLQGFGLATVLAVRVPNGRPTRRPDMADLICIPERESPLALAGLLALGLGAGLSPFFYAYYDASVWAPQGLGLIAMSAFVWMTRPPRLAGPATLALGGLAGLGLWSLASIGWAESVESAVVSGNRWLVYAALLVSLLVLVRNERSATAVLAAAGVGISTVALSVLLRLLGHAPSAIFLGGRLNLPLGYINGEGCLFVMGFWLCIAAAESRRVLFAAPAMAFATLMACLALLSQSRGAAIAVLIALLAVIVLLPGRIRRAYALGLAGIGVALAGPSLLHVYDSARGGIVTLGTAHEAGVASLLAALATGGVWGMATQTWNVAGSHGLDLAPMRKLASWAFAVPALLVLVLAVGAAHSIGREVGVQWRAFTHLAPPVDPAAPARQQAGQTHASQSGDAVVPSENSSESRSRLLSGAGNRYDYWRIAWGLWREHPLAGVGAGSYAPSYYERRATTEDIQQPHSIELEALSELGLVGAALLALFFGAVAWGALRMRRLSRASTPVRACAVAGTGCFVAWATQASVDWMHLLPGLTAVALIAAAALLWPRPVGSVHRRAGIFGACALLATLVVAGGSLSRQTLAQLYADRARGELATNPASAATDADRSLAIDSDAVQTYYVKAAALAHFDQAAAADATLRQAVAREPRNFVTWALLGDIAVREGRLAAARSYYGRAHALNPRNATLAALAADPVVVGH